MDMQENVRVRLKVGEAKHQADIGKSIARMDNDAMNTLGVTDGDVVQIDGKKPTPAKVLAAYPEDHGLGLIRIDGFTRKNCSVSINDFVSVRKVEAEYATSVKLVPVDIRISVDSDFIEFLRDRVVDRPVAKGDILQVMMLGHSVPFHVFDTVPDELVKVGPFTELSIDPFPISDMEEMETKKRRKRFRHLKELEKKYAADETWFYMAGLEVGESEHRSMDEADIITVAKRVARKEDKIVEIRVELLERRGSIEPDGFMWAKVSPSGKVRYVYPNE